MDQEKTTFTCPFGTYAYRRMPFGFCNAPAAFQRCMLAIFHDMIKESIEVFMDDFSVFRNSFKNCLNNLDKMLQRCKDANLVFSWEKCYFMVKEGIVLGRKVSDAGLEVNKTKIYVISKLPPPTNVKGIRSFMGHADFYRRKKGTKNVAADHLSRIDNDDTSDDSDVDDNIPSETLMEITIKDTPWFADFANYLVGHITWFATRKYLIEKQAGQNLNASKTSGMDSSNLGEEYDKVFNHLNMLHAPLEGKDGDGVRMMMVDVACRGDGGDVTSGVGVVRKWWWSRLLQPWCGEAAAATLVVVVATVVRWLWGDDGAVVASKVVDRVDRR
ncbi:reverse transcriptase domain-containing protein [Tanacetum coccineum]